MPCTVKIFIIGWCFQTSVNSESNGCDQKSRYKKEKPSTNSYTFTLHQLWFSLNQFSDTNGWTLLLNCWQTLLDGARGTEFWRNYSYVISDVTTNVISRRHSTSYQSRTKKSNGHIYYTHPNPPPWLRVRLVWFYNYHINAKFKNNQDVCTPYIFYTQFGIAFGNKKNVCNIINVTFRCL